MDSSFDLSTVQASSTRQNLPIPYWSIAGIVLVLFTFLLHPSLAGIGCKVSQLGDMPTSVEELRPDAVFYSFGGKAMDNSKAHIDWNGGFYSPAPTFSHMYMPGIIPIAEGGGTISASAEHNHHARIADNRVGANGVKDNGRLRVEGTKILNQRGEVLQLRGLSSHGIHWYPHFTNIRALWDIKSRGANLFRVAMYADSNYGGYNDNRRSLELNKNLLRLAVENSLEADLYTIIDWHLLEDENPLLKVDQAIAFFDEVSMLYSNEPGIIYEICNEPNGSTTWQDIYQYAERVIPEIRKNAPNAIIIVGTPNYSTEVLRVLDSPLPYDNLVYAYHMYTGYSNYQFRDLLDAVQEAGVAVFVSEWGISKGEGRDYFDVDEGADFLEYMHHHHIGWAYWALCNAERDYVVFKNESTKLYGWTDDDLTIPGKVVFSALRDGLPQLVKDDLKRQ